jgi:hypothetical protein
MYNIQLTYSNTRQVKYLKAHLLRGGRIVSTRWQQSARRFKSEAEAQEFINKVSPYFHGTWTAVPYTPIKQASNA